jgi:hypothetical protein
MPYMSLHPTSWRSILILSSHLRMGFPSGYFPSGFPTKTLYTSILPPKRATCTAHLILLDLITRTIMGEEYRSLSSSLCSSLPCYLIPLRSKYSQYPIFKHPQPTFLPLCERPSFTPIQNNKQNYSSVYLNLYIFRQQTGWQKIQHWMIASIPCLQSVLNFFLNRLFKFVSVVPKYLKSSTLSKELL